MHIVTDEAEEPSAVELLAMDICELREDIDELRDRLDGNKPRSMAHMRKQRAQRWERTLAIVRAAVAELGASCDREVSH
jgi:hypothetical protein